MSAPVAAGAGSDKVKVTRWAKDAKLKRLRALVCS